jgi:hypothetical protein
MVCMTSRKLIGSPLIASPAWIIEAFTFAAEHWQQLLRVRLRFGGFW